MGRSIITKELREWNRMRVVRSEEKMYVERIANRIDELHDDEVARWIEQAHFEDLQEMSDEERAKLGFVRLPVDADGKAWHVGDAYKLKGDNGADAADHISWLSWDGHFWDADGEPVEHLERWKATPVECLRGFTRELYYDGRLGDGERDKLLAIADELEAAK